MKGAEGGPGQGPRPRDRPGGVGSRDRPGRVGYRGPIRCARGRGSLLASGMGYDRRDRSPTPGVGYPGPGPRTGSQVGEPTGHQGPPGRGPGPPGRRSKAPTDQGSWAPTDQGSWADRAGLESKSARPGRPGEPSYQGSQPMVGRRVVADGWSQAAASQPLVQCARRSEGWTGEAISREPG